MRRAAERPNILFIITHDTGEHVGCYGAAVETPNIDRLAGEGVRFENSFCTAPQCSPSRGSVLTGKYPHRNGLVGLAHLGWELNEGEVTLPMVLGEARYETYLFGVQHESRDAARLGYAHVRERGASAEGAFAGSGARATEWFLAELPALASARKPFFASVGFLETHRPFPHARDGRRAGEVKVPAWLPDRPGIREDIAGLEGLVREADRCVGRMMDGLEGAGIADRTLVIFTTDHGVAMPRAKGTCYDPGVKVALIMRPPGSRMRGTPGVRSEMVSNVDILPTLCEVAGAGRIEGIDGRSFLALLEGRGYEARKDVFLEMTWHDRYNPMRAVRTERWKYVRNFGERPMVYLPKDIFLGRAGEEVREEYYAGKRPAEELYDLREDPLERRNVAGEAGCAGVLAELRGRVEEWMRETGDRLLAGDWPPTEEQRERDRADATPN
ncbi:MAG: sulfatase [Planctomycetota bacterium]